MVNMDKKSINRRCFLKRAGCGTLAGIVAGSRLKAAGRKPNILLILVDDLGYGDLSSYGAGRQMAPGAGSPYLRWTGVLIFSMVSWAI